MDVSTFQRWTREFKGIATATKEAGDGRITVALVRALQSITVQRVDRDMLRQYCERGEEDWVNETRTSRQSWRFIRAMCVVWANGCVSHFWPGPFLLIDENPAKENYFCHKFLERADVDHVVVIELGVTFSGEHQENVEYNTFRLTVYKPPRDCSLDQMTKEVFESLGV